MTMRRSIKLLSNFKCATIEIVPQIEGAFDCGLGVSLRRRCTIS
jgi:hypothetical protein